MKRLQKLAWVYAIGFFLVVLSGHVPGLSTKSGLLLGGFNIDLVDDILHSLSGLWAAWSAWKSPLASRFYFRAFGTFYTADAFLGFFTGYAFTDFITGRWDANAGYSLANVGYNLAVNAPHFIIGPVALYIGFYYSRKLNEKHKAIKNKK